MNKNRDNILCEYSDEESAFVKGALSSDRCTEGEQHFHMSLTSKEYILYDFSMFDAPGEEGFYPVGDKDGTDGDITGEEMLASAFAKAESEPASEEYAMTADASLTYDDKGRAVLRYMESLDGETEQICEISFDPALPGLVTISKVGMVSTLMTFVLGKRHSCVYRTPFIDFEMRIRTLRADNTITADGGVLRLDYALEIRGAAAHRTVMEITLEKE